MKDPSELPQSGFVPPRWVKMRYAISNSTMYQWIADKHLPAPIKIGPRASRFSAADLRLFEEKLQTAKKLALDTGNSVSQPNKTPTS